MKINQLVLPINTEILIPKNDSVRLFNDICDDLDYGKLYDSYATLSRNHYSPKILFKIIVYAYMNQIYSSRKIEKACRRDINFMWLLEGQKAPDHNTINRFRQRLTSIIEDLFYQLISLLGEKEEIEFKNIFVDGTKLEANANKYTFVWKKSTKKFEARLQEKIKDHITKLNTTYETTFLVEDSPLDISVVDSILSYLNDKKEELGIEFVYGKGKRKHQLQRDIESFEEYQLKQEKYDNYNATFDGRNSFSKIDTDATFMHMKDDHMRNSQLKPGYNIQIGVEGEYIVGMDIFSERSDQLTLIPFLDNLTEKLPKTYKNIIADAGYESEENYQYLDTHEHTPYIKPSNYERSKSRAYKKKINLRENMDYDKENDTYICHNNKILHFIGMTTRTSKSGYKAKIKIYECENCDECSYKHNCTKSKNNRKIYVSEKFINYRKESTLNITSKEGKKLRMNRSIQVEGAFGVLKEDYGFRRFLTRGKKNVKTEFMLLCFGYNINKLHQKKMRKKEGVTLHSLKTA
jgi:transposase